jgi:glutathione S-transferase
MDERLVLHEDPISGNCYKVALTASLVGLPIERRRYDILRGETRTPEFLAGVNANGRIPVLQVGDRFLPESNAACVFLAEGSRLIPQDRFDRADMLRWMFWEQYNHEPNIATLRFWVHAIGADSLTEAQRAQIPAKRAAGDSALKLMDEHLERRRYLVAERLTLADIALYAYTHVAGEGGFDLLAYPAIGRWLTEVAAEAGYIPM